MDVPRGTMLRLLHARDRLGDARARRRDADARQRNVARTLLRSFSRAFGVMPHDFVMERRFERAKRALARGASVTGASLKAGYESLGSLSPTFGMHFGVPRREWQRRVRTVLPSAALSPAGSIPACFLCVRALSEKRALTLG